MKNRVIREYEIKWRNVLQCKLHTRAPNCKISFPYTLVNDELDLSDIFTDITMHDYKDTDKLSKTVKVAKAALLVCRRTIYLVILLGYLI